MTPRDLIKAAMYPLTSGNVLVAMISFWLLSKLAAAAGLLGILLAILVVLGVFRYQVILLEDRASGREPRPPGIEFFSWFDNNWSLFPAVVVVAIAWGSYAINSSAGVLAMLLFVVLVGGLYPAMLGVLAITHSPLQSMNPQALLRFISACGASYWITVVYLVLIAYLLPIVEQAGGFLSGLIELFLIFSLHSVIGTVIAPHGLIDDISIPDELEPDQQQLAASVEQARIAALGHAYGFISRENREGGFSHVIDSINADPDPVAAWAWHFERMLGWENQTHALFFAQRYIHDMLQHGETIPTLKVIMRCRLVDEQFRPLRDDIAAAIAAADANGNNELSAVLKRP